MKNRRGKVHPSSSSDDLSVLSLLPAASISLVALLSHEDRQVLAYMLTRSLKSTDLIPSNFPAREDKKPSPCLDGKSPALFDCDCFRCYTSFWVRWDSSPNRDLIHQAIEAFEDNLSKGDKMGRRKNGSAAVESPESVDAVDPVSGDEGNELVAVGRGSERLARNALPDVMGIIGSRLRNLWSPKV